VPRFVVLDGVDDATAARVAAGLGQHVRRVSDSATAGEAVLAAVRGADLVVLAAAPREVIDQLCDDLRRLGDLDHRVGDGGAAGPVLSAEERAVLAQLMAGRSLGEAARALHLSRRTADRRLAAARRTLGAASTSEALVAARRNGVTAAE
jgi:DNA-binding CsgD family transcriptional regulator